MQRPKPCLILLESEYAACKQLHERRQDVLLTVSLRFRPG